MARTLKLPDGRVSKVIKGGPSSLKKLVPLLRERAFTGYLKLVSETRRETGYMVMREGKQVEAYYQGPRGTLRGKGALAPLRELSRHPDVLIEVHVDADLSAVLPPSEDQGTLARGFSALKRKLDDWRSQGQDAAPVEEALQGDPPRARRTAVEPPPSGKEADGFLPSPDVRGAIRDLSDRPGEGPGSSDETAPSVPGARPPRAEEPGVAPPGPEPPSRLRATGKSGPPPIDAASGLHQEYTFDNLLVGDYNRFAHAAGVAIADGAVDPYSPLFIVGRPGLGKTHLLHAIGNRLRARNPREKVLYLTASRYWSELQRADRAGETSEFRDRFFGLDLLLLDDVQDVEGRNRVQEELFELFEDFRRQGKPMVMVADRYPSAMKDVDARLVSRLEAGLVADLQVPDAETRLGYLEFLVRRRGAECPKTVLRFLAERYTVDMRELEGALNKVLAYGSAQNRRVDLPLAQEALGEGKGSTTLAPLEQRPEFLPAHSYLLEEARGERALRLFAQKVRSVRGLLITRTNPRRLRERFGMDGVDLIWLTDRVDSEEKTVEPVLERILHRMESFMVAGGQGVVMLDGFEFLKSANSFEAVLKFLRQVVDQVAESEFTFLVTLSPGTLEEKELQILEREMEPVPLS